MVCLFSFFYAGGGANAVGSLVFLTSRAGKKSSALLVTSGPQGPSPKCHTSNTAQFAHSITRDYIGYFCVYIVISCLKYFFIVIIEMIIFLGIVHFWNVYNGGSLYGTIQSNSEITAMTTDKANDILVTADHGGTYGQLT
jgi:hypothetical protein